MRLGIQGVELLTTGRITLPIFEPERTWLRELRLGQHSLTDALDRIAALRKELEHLTAESSPLPEHPDHDEIDRWLIGTYRQWWSTPAVKESTEETIR